MLQRGRGTRLEVRQNFRRVTKLIASGSGLESRAIDGNSPVRESNQPLGGGANDSSGSEDRVRTIPGEIARRDRAAS